MKTERETYAHERYTMIEKTWAQNGDDALLEEMEDLEEFLAEMEYHRRNGETWETLVIISEDFILSCDLSAEL